MSDQGKVSGVLDLGNLGKSEAAAGVKDITTAEFMAEVIEASNDQPVLVDFWAPWCGPCRQLGPALEKVVAGTKGAVKLVKMNIDEHPEIAGQMGIQSIPAVVAFVQGRPKDAFMGAIPEGEIAKFIEKLGVRSGPDATEQLVAEADKAAKSGQATHAAELYAAVLQQEPGNPAALAGMGMLYLDSGDLERARAMLEAVPEEENGNQRVSGLKTAIELAEQAQELGDAEELANQLAANPDDHQARFDLALLYNAKGRRMEAAEQLLEIVRRDRTWKDDGARSQLLQFFEAWGPADAASQGARRQLSSILFS